MLSVHSHSYRSLFRSTLFHFNFTVACRHYQLQKKEILVLFNSSTVEVAHMTSAESAALKQTRNYIYMMWDLRIHICEDSSRVLLGCDAVLFCGRITAFQRSMLLLSSGWLRQREPLKLWSPTTTLHSSQPRGPRLDFTSIRYVLVPMPPRSVV
jgi:hypothetical protein